MLMLTYGIKNNLNKEKEKWYNKNTKGQLVLHKTDYGDIWESELYMVQKTNPLSELES